MICGVTTSIAHRREVVVFQIIIAVSAISLFSPKKTMTTGTEKSLQLVSPEDGTNKNTVTLEDQTNNDKLQFVKDKDELGSPKSPNTKKWFLKEFGVRKGTAKLEGGTKPQPLKTAPFQGSRRRSSSLPDLTAMLDAASLMRYGSFITASPGPARLASKEVIENLKKKQEGRKEREGTKRNKEMKQGKAKGNMRKELEGGAKPHTISTGLVPKSRRRSRSVPDLSWMLNKESLKGHGSSTAYSPTPVRMTRKQAILSDKDAPWALQSQQVVPAPHPPGNDILEKTA